MKMNLLSTTHSTTPSTTFLAALTATITAALLFSSLATADEASTADKIKDALALEYRTDEERARDRNRAPAAALSFMGIRDDMNVFEFGPGSGWYTKILAPVLKDKGKLSIGYPAEWLAALDGMMESEHMEKVRRVNLDMQWDNDLYAFDFDGVDFETDNLDLFLNIREYHNLYGDERAEFNNAVFDALKPGGTYVIIDHTRRHMESDTPENKRREDPVLVIEEVQNAGFELEKFSTMFYRADDTLQYEVGRRSVAGNTDRFFLVFKKPM